MNEETLRSEETAPMDASLPIEAIAESPSSEPIVACNPQMEPLDESAPQTSDVSDITHRLAEEFFLLREEFPAIHSPEQLPNAVLDMAVEKNLSLFDAYLRFCYEEHKRVQLEEQRRQEAAARSAGSLMQGTEESAPEQEAFLRAFRTALK